MLDGFVLACSILMENHPKRENNWIVINYSTTKHILCQSAVKENFRIVLYESYRQKR